MLDLQELDDLICQQLARQDLVRCARVSRKWHSIVVPHIWRNLSLQNAQKNSFCRIVLTDYLEQKLLDEGRVVEQDLHPPSCSALSALSKYAPCIRVLPDPDGLHVCFYNEIAARRVKITAARLVLYLFNRCSPVVQVDSFMIGTLALLHEPGSPWKTIMDSTLPRVRHLRVQSKLSSGREVSRLMDLLDLCSDILWELELDVTIPIGSRKDDPWEDQTENEPKDWKSLKKLTLHGWTDDTDAETFWPWLFKRCGQVERLQVWRVCETARVLAQAMLAHMPKLNEAILGAENSRQEVNDVAELLSGSRKGWRVLAMCRPVNLGPTEMKAFESHFSTLEALVIHEGDAVWRKIPLQVLSSCPNLHTFSCTYVYSGFGFNAKLFEDRDPVTGLLKPWKCEASLKVLKITIIGAHDPVGESLQGVELHDLVYDRLARLTKLETLSLGNGAYLDRPDCLKMSLESGLYKLSGLTMLKELTLLCGRTRIGVEEVQWMTRHWPRLRGIYGLEEGGDDEEAVIWLQKNHPEIELWSSWAPWFA
ncbi:MAG: hypothetical protein J3Q66DRAFT_414464 [Benniella sp.]|nr:MAG: hypothetical protein J3Q66DRAFT_414464 [Benniella sp.]